MENQLILHIVLCARALVYQITTQAGLAGTTNTRLTVSPSYTRITQVTVKPANGRVSKCEQQHGQCQVPQLYCPPWGGSIYSLWVLWHSRQCVRIFVVFMRIKKSCVNNSKVAYWHVTHIANSCPQAFQIKKSCAQGLNYMATWRDYTTDI